MALTDAQFLAWLKDSAAIRCMLVEVGVQVGGVEITRYLSNKGYVTEVTDTPPNTTYSPYIVGGIKLTEQLSIDGTASLTTGDIELDNLSGDRDAWLDDIWANRQIKVFIGDMRWPRADFRLVHDGMVAQLDTKNRTRINLRVSDKLQRLNTPISETKLGGSTNNADKLIPLCFGEVHNVEPLLVDSLTNKYQVHNGVIESIIEVRDNGIPVGFTPNLTLGTFTLAATPVGQVTCSVQGARVSNPNRLTRSNEFTHSDWVKTNVTVALAASVAAPDGTTGSVYKVTSANTTARISIKRNSTGTANTIATPSLYVKPAGWNYLTIFHDLTSPGILEGNFYGSTTVVSLLTGAVVTGTAPVVVTAVGVDGWFRVELAATPTTTTHPVQFCPKPTSVADVNAIVGDGINGIYVWHGQLEYGAQATEYVDNAGATIVPDTYINTPAAIARRLAMEYGVTERRFTLAEVDAVAFAAFDVVNRQAVGLYCNDRQIVVDSMHKLAASVGGRVMIKRNSKLSIVRLDLIGTAGTTVEPKDILQQSLQVSNLPIIYASSKIGYCKNWTVQSSGLSPGLPTIHLDLFKEQWLTVTRTNSQTALDYRTSEEPVMAETLLITNADAVGEALRRVDLWSVKRKIFKYEGMPWLMLESLGGYQTIYNSRFNLSGGASGQIVSLATDWLNPHITVEVLI